MPIILFLFFLVHFCGKSEKFVNFPMQFHLLSTWPLGANTTIPSVADYFPRLRISLAACNTPRYGTYGIRREVSSFVYWEVGTFVGLLKRSLKGRATDRLFHLKSYPSCKPPLFIASPLYNLWETCVRLSALPIEVTLRPLARR